MSSYSSISPDKLSRLIGTTKAPTLVDVRVDTDFAADPQLIPGAIRRSHLDVQEWAPRLSGQSVMSSAKRDRSSAKAPPRGSGAATLQPERRGARNENLGATQPGERS